MVFKKGIIENPHPPSTYTYFLIETIFILQSAYHIQYMKFINELNSVCLIRGQRILAWRLCIDQTMLLAMRKPNRQIQNSEKERKAIFTFL